MSPNCEYSPHSIDHFLEVLSSILRSAVRWKRLDSNPAEGVILPKIMPVRSKWVLAPKEACALIVRLGPKPNAMVVPAIFSGMWRGSSDPGTRSGIAAGTETAVAKDAARRSVFGTRNGQPENPNNILRRHVYPACDALKLRRATWLTLRRTFSSWCEASAVPDKVNRGADGTRQRQHDAECVHAGRRGFEAVAIERLGQQIHSPEVGQIFEDRKMW
jgi:hypothetical protein